jgi:hypothetical protein
MSKAARTFENEAIERLARIEERLLILVELPGRVTTIEQKISKHENRFWGWVIGISSASTAGGVAFGDAIKGVFKTIGGH